MRWLSYLLVFLSIAAPVNDTRAVDSSLLSIPIADDDDECLSARRRSHAEEILHREPPSTGATIRVEVSSSARTPVSAERDRLTPFAVAYLHVFMSLQL
ncbi:unnamed protein product [Gemmata massiliana]|uniref:Uncharacterized protein n=1 Tax=Gemmata massiliana TaxID=1210884 RepID=A0A6P2D8N4_9BACT|nr:hypothetical protein [Gemmata massiliana]VTR96735.1 unnamed protein product [Gemmata massiliana]